VCEFFCVMSESYQMSKINSWIAEIKIMNRNRLWWPTLKPMIKKESLEVSLSDWSNSRTFSVANTSTYRALSPFGLVHIIRRISCKILLITTGMPQWYSAGLRAGWLGVRVPIGAGKFSHHRVQNGSGAYPASYPMGTGSSFPGDKAAEEWNWPLTSI
jgi:hypothetical protein